MKKEYCDIFNRCFPQFGMSYERFSSLIHKDTNSYIEYSENREICGFAVTESCAVRLICVSPEKQGYGIGSRLLSQAEEHISANGYDRAITGGVSSGMFIGAVSESWEFFEKKGYISKGSCEEMLIELKAPISHDYHFHGHDLAEYGWFSDDMEEIRKAVSSVDKDWVQYFTAPERIFVGRVNGEIASFCLVDTDCTNYLTDSFGRVGMPGCVGTVPKFRNKGIGLEMVSRATELLREQGMDISFIFFTGVGDWYRKIGYRTFLTEIFGEKRL